MMTTTYPMTHFTILSNPSKFNLFPISISLSHRCPVPNYKTTKKLGIMGERIIKISALDSKDDERNNVSVFEQETLIDGSSKVGNLSPDNIEATLNRLSKWLMTALFGAVILYRRDADALWAGIGSITNTTLSAILKRILNQERPASSQKSDPGMPSSHAQSIFYTVSFIILSMVEWLGVNEVTLLLGAISLVFGSYLSWLRVTQGLHTINQVVVGAVLGTCFALLWLWSWNAFVLDAFNTFLWVRLSVFLCAAVFGLAFVSYVIRNWFSDEI